jgi:hypothetical protein
MQWSVGEKICWLKESVLWWNGNASDGSESSTNGKQSIANIVVDGGFGEAASKEMITKRIK